MGIIRFILAISVVFSHTYGHIFIHGINAVQCFYVISGFLIAGILPKKNSWHSLWKFYLSRYLRLYPTYIFIALLTIIFFVLNNHGELFNAYKKLPASATAISILTNLFIIGQDVLFFLCIKTNELFFTSHSDDGNLNRLLLLPQSWTLAIELYFYLLAPFILRKKIIYIFLVCSVGIRIYLLYLGLGNQEQWAYRFFPTELTLFIFGAISRQKLLTIYEKKFHKNIKGVSQISTLIFTLYIINFSIIPGSLIIKSIILILTLILIMPFLFNYSKFNKFDQTIGAISYPIYISHILIYAAMIKLSGILNITEPFEIAIYTLILTVAFSILILNFLENPIKKLRHKIY